MPMRWLVLVFCLTGAGIEGLRCYQCVHTALGRDVVGEGCRRPDNDDRLIATCPAHLNHCSLGIATGTLDGEKYYKVERSCDRSCHPAYTDIDGIRAARSCCYGDLCNHSPTIHKPATRNLHIYITMVVVMFWVLLPITN